MMQGSKVIDHDVLAQEWSYDFLTRPAMSIKVERKLHDMRIEDGLWECGARNNPYSIIII